MHRKLAALSFVLLAACTPPSSENSTSPTTTTAEAAVHAIYADAQSKLGGAAQANIPMSDDLRSVVDRAEAAAQARNEPFIEGDLALNCQDCTSVSELAIGPQTGAQQEPARQGHTWVQATFKLNGNEDRRVLWDMIESPQGWRVDDIVSEGFDLRTEAQAYLDSPAPPAGDQAP